ncbi:MAG TPA: thioesterase family protein, partial [Ottowia sp.]|nr:thioesterase family protein [Ottowia sp.]
MTRPPMEPPPIAFEPEFADGLRLMFEQQVVFNRVIGLKLLSIRPDGVQGRIDMREELIGHFGHRRIHGGVISAGLDAMGGIAT